MINFVGSYAVLQVTPGGKDFSNRASSAFTPSMASIAFASVLQKTPNPAEDFPLNLLLELYDSAQSSILAMSFKRNIFPFASLLTIIFSNSSTVFKRPLTSTLNCIYSFPPSEPRVPAAA